MKRTVEAAVIPVSISDLKAYLRIDGNEENDLLDSLIRSAVDWVENYTRRALITQTWQVELPRFPWKDHVHLPWPPLQSVESVVYTNFDNQELDFEAFTADLHRNTAVLNYGCTWPAAVLAPVDPVVIEFVCGYGDDAKDVPAAIRNAIKLLSAHLYENREPVVIGSTISRIPFTIEALLGPYRWVKFA